MPKPRPRKILIVEDDPKSMEILVEGISKAGYIVESAPNAEEALAKVKFWKPHLVLTDYDMPGLSGLEMLKILRKNQNYVTVILVSGRSETKSIADALRSGADDYIKKPYRVEELLARVEVALRHNSAHRELLEANQKLQEMVDQDHLTSLYNMRSMYEKIDYELKRGEQGDSQVACIMLDMDHFKSVNDENDHLFGSFVLKEVGKLIISNIRDVDFAARYGGDEFLIVLGETSEKGTQGFCERLRSVVENYDFRDGENFIKLTVSIGYSLSKKGIHISSRDLVRSADHALYEAKNSGRNRVAAAVEE